MDQPVTIRTPPEVRDQARLEALASYAILDTLPEAGFDDIVHLACRLCSVPVALVSFVDRDRQWFKARVGFPPCETDLDRSVCAHALAHPDKLLVIPDLTQDPRTAGNPLVTGEPFIRFYAGAPLVAPDGDVLGSLCVIDTKPRPGGLMGSQADDLRALARQVMSQLELRRALASRDAARAAEAEAQRAVLAGAYRQQAIFDSTTEFAIVVTDLDGHVTDWNSGAKRTLGWAADEMVGRTLERFFTPEDRAAGQAGTEMRGAREQGRAADERWHLRRDGSRFWASGEMMPLRDADGAHRGYVKVLRDRTDEHLAGKALELAEERLRQAEEAGGIGLFTVDVATNVLTPTPEFCRLYGLPVRAAYPAAAIEAQVLPEDRHLMSTQADRVRGEVRRAVEYRVRDSGTGAVRWIARTGGIELDAAGRPLRLYGVARDVTEAREAQEALRASEAHWRGLFDRLSEGYIVGEVIRGGDGRVADWRYVEANPAWGELVGIDPAGVVGRTVRELFPGIGNEQVAEFAQVVDTRTPATFTRQVGNLRRWYEGRTFALEGERFGVIFLEVTTRVQAEARRGALLALGDALRDLATVPEMTRAAAGIVGRTLGASRAGFGRVLGEVEEVEIEPDWTAPGVAGIAGRHRFDDYGSIREHLRRGEALVIDDVALDPRTRDDPGPMRAVGIEALVNMPVRERGRTVAVFIVHDARARSWTLEELAFLRNVADRVEAGVARVRAEEQQTVLNGELAHRLKNTLTLVQSMASQTLKGVSERDLVDAFTRRVLALSRAHDVLLQKSWAAARMRSVMESVLTLQADLDRFALDGPDMDLSSQAALSLSLLLHELATNAVKYGALSAEAGQVRIAWRTEPGEAPSLVLDWSERGGPAVAAPRGRTGFGSRLIRMGLMGTRAADLRYEPEGLQAEFRAPLAVLQAQVH